jgi:hypothetical protein
MVVLLDLGRCRKRGKTFIRSTHSLLLVKSIIWWRHNFWRLLTPSIPFTQHSHSFIHVCNPESDSTASFSLLYPPEDVRREKIKRQDRRTHTRAKDVHKTDSNFLLMGSWRLLKKKVAPSFLLTHSEESPMKLTIFRFY